MNEPAVRVDKVGKRYRVGGPQSGYGTLREAIVSAAQVPIQFLRNGGQRYIREQFWALKDVSFEVRQGEVLGIIGKNGAGKSTLLKILARVTHPTAGRAEISGRVGSLIEVGTGFHPELTGRENIFLNGAILGMKRVEILQKFDAIVGFAEIDRFLDTPVKRYSSGMYMRLAFSIAAHLDPEILIVDEVLAVGDAAFQKKCLGKMEKVASEGRTVLFVSHNMPAVISLCNRALLLESGKLTAEGTPASIVQQYLDKEMATSVIPLDQREDRSGDGSARIEYLKVESTDPDKIIRSGSCLKLTIGYSSERPVQRPQFVVSIYDQMETGIFLLHNDFVGGLPETLPPRGSVTCLTEPINLTPGRCFMHIELLKGNVRADLVHYAGYFDVEADDLFGSGMVPPRDWVLYMLGHSWRLNED
jgi:lipopolysaccharide transport system ATP-binding protein